MHILGFNCFAHDAAAAIIRDGEMLGLVEEERFLRKKHIGDFPKHSIKWCCDVAGIQPSQLDHVVFYWDPKLALWQRVWHVLRYFPRSSTPGAQRCGIGQHTGATRTTVRCPGPTRGTTGG